MKGYCEDPRCQYKRQERRLYLHSTELYWPAEALKRKYYKACGACVEEDHRKWEEINRK